MKLLLLLFFPFPQTTTTMYCYTQGPTGIHFVPCPVCSPSLMKQIVTTVVTNTPNSFLLPIGTSNCIVTRNIAQSPGIDYNIVSGAVIFTSTPKIGDIVQLNCW